MTTTDRATDASHPATPGDAEAKRRLAVYLRDHDAGAQAGVALIRRCRDANAGTEFESDLNDLAHDIAADRESLRSIMDRLEVTPSRVKELLATGAELVGRLKSNGSLVRYSPSSRVVELEAMAAGVATKRNLWRSLAAAPTGLQHQELERLTSRATEQFERLLALHERAARIAFAATG